MKNIEDLYHLLCSESYLPPRNEEELLEQEKRYSNYNFKNEGKHINSETIANGDYCQISSIKMFDNSIVAEPFGMAARNFENLPSDIINKIKKQHIKGNDNHE